MNYSLVHSEGADDPDSARPVHNPQAFPQNRLCDMCQMSDCVVEHYRIKTILWILHGCGVHNIKAKPQCLSHSWVQALVVQVETDGLSGVGCCRNRKLCAAAGRFQHTLAVDVRHQPGNCYFNSFHCILHFIPKTHASGAFASNQKYPSDISSSNTLASRSNIMGLYGLAPMLRFF